MKLRFFRCSIVIFGQVLSLLVASAFKKQTSVNKAISNKKILCLIKNFFFSTQKVYQLCFSNILIFVPKPNFTQKNHNLESFNLFVKTIDLFTFTSSISWIFRCKMKNTNFQIIRQNDWFVYIYSVHQVNFTNFSIQNKNANNSKITGFFFSCWNNNVWSKFYVSLAITIIWDFLKQFSITMSSVFISCSTWKVLLPYFNQKDDWKTSKETPQPKFFRTRELRHSKIRKQYWTLEVNLP